MLIIKNQFSILWNFWYISAVNDIQIVLFFAYWIQSLKKRTSNEIKFVSHYLKPQVISCINSQQIKHAYGEHCGEKQRGTGVPIRKYVKTLSEYQYELFKKLNEKGIAAKQRKLLETLLWIKNWLMPLRI